MRCDGGMYVLRLIDCRYMESGSLSDVLKVSGALSEPLIAEICIQVLRGLLYLHSDRRIIHRYTSSILCLSLLFAFDLCSHLLFVIPPSKPATSNHPTFCASPFTISLNPLTHSLFFSFVVCSQHESEWSSEVGYVSFSLSDVSVKR